MKLPRCVLVSVCIFLLLSVQAAKAQVSVYGSVMATAFGFKASSSGSDVDFESDTVGLAGGVIYAFPTQSRLSTGIDLRGSYSPGTRGGESFSGAFRLGFVPRKVRLRPYFEIGPGLVTAGEQQYFSTFVPSSGLVITSETLRKTGATLNLIFGLDVRLTPNIDLRPFEFGGYAPLNRGQGSPAMSFVDIGVVYHLHHAKP